MSRRSLAKGSLLAAVTFLAYLPVLHAGFVWDDDSMLTRNPLIRAGDGLRQFWFSARAADYWPMTSTTFWAEWRLWGLHPLGYHATNVALHAVAVILFWQVLVRVRIPGGFWAALWFAVHPVNVESVAWIAERKNLLAMVFFLAAIGWYLGSDQGLRGRYAASLGAFVLAMLSKGSVAFLPLVLVGLVASRRRLVRRDGLRLIPFFLIAGGLTVVNLWFQQRSALVPIRIAGPVDRVLGAAAVVWFYLGKALWPFHLSFVYPLWRPDAARALWWVPLAAALVVTVVLAARGPRSGWRAWAYFCVALVPAMGLTDVYFMKYSLVADHYQHLALLGVAAWLGWKWDAWLHASGHSLPLFVAGLVIAVLGVLTWRQCGLYSDDERLFLAAERVNPNSWMVENNLGVALQQKGRSAEAVEHLQRAAALAPGLAETHYNLGIAYAAAGNPAQAAVEDECALRLQPNYPAAQGNLGTVLLRAGRLSEATFHYEIALRSTPDDPVAQNGIGTALARMGRAQDAVPHFEAAVRLQPGSAGAHANLGNALALVGRWQEAAAQYSAALELDPDLGGVRARLAFVRQQLTPGHPQD